MTTDFRDWLTVDDESSVKCVVNDGDLNQINLKYKLTDKNGDFDKSIFDSYSYDLIHVEAMQGLENAYPKVIWTTNSNLSWLTWFKSDELGFEDGISSKIFSCEEVYDLNKKQFLLQDILQTKVQCGWGDIKDSWKLFGLGYGGDPVPIEVYGKTYYNCPPPKKIIHSKFCDLGKNNIDYDKVLEYDCYALWLDNGYDKKHYRVYGIFNSLNGLVVRSLQLYCNLYGIDISFEINHWDEYTYEQVEMIDGVREKFNSFVNLLEYMNSDPFSLNEETPYYEKEHNEYEKDFSYENIVLAKWSDGKFYHARIEHVDEENNFYVSYIGYGDTCKVNEEDILQVHNCREIHEAELEVKKAELNLKKAELRLKKSVFYMK